MERTDIREDKLTYDCTLAHTRTNKRHGRAVAHFRRVRMRSSVSQPSLLHGSYMLNGTHGPSGMIDYNNKGFLDALYTYVA